MSLAIKLARILFIKTLFYFGRWIVQRSCKGALLPILGLYEVSSGSFLEVIGDFLS